MKCYVHSRTSYIHRISSYGNTPSDRRSELNNQTEWEAVYGSRKGAVSLQRTKPCRFCGRFGTLQFQFGQVWLKRQANRWPWMFLHPLKFHQLRCDFDECHKEQRPQPRRHTVNRTGPQLFSNSMLPSPFPSTRKAPKQNSPHGSFGRG